MPVKPWLRIDYDLTRHRKLARLPSDTARWGWIAVLGEAKVSDTPGGFADDDHFRERVGRFARYLDDYLSAGLLERTTDGELRIHEWGTYQTTPSAETPGAKRTREYRERLREREARHRDANGDSHDVVTPSVTRALSSLSLSRDVTNGRGGGAHGEGVDAYASVALEVERLTNVPYAVGDPHSKMGERVGDLIERHGVGHTIAALQAIANEVRVRTQRDPTVRQLVFAASDYLDPVVTVRPPDPDCGTCLNTGITAAGDRCPDCHRGRKR